MEITKTIKLVGVEMEALFEKENKNIRVKFSELVDIENLSYDDSKTYKYQILFRCSEGTTDQEIKEFVKSVKGTKPKLRAEYISQIHVFETVNKMFITNTKDFTIRQLEDHFEFIEKAKKSIWRSTFSGTGSNTFKTEGYSINIGYSRLTKIATLKTLILTQDQIRDLITSGRNIKEVGDLFDNFNKNA